MKSFNTLLKKRVQNNKKLSFDIHMIRQATNIVIDEMFGETGGRYIKVKDWDGKSITLNISKSVWRNEIQLIRGKLIFNINKNLNQKIVRYIKINR